MQSMLQTLTVYPGFPTKTPAEDILIPLVPLVKVASQVKEQSVEEGVILAIISGQWPVGIPVLAIHRT